MAWKTIGSGSFAFNIPPAGFRYGVKGKVVILLLLWDTRQQDATWNQTVKYQLLH